jgi:hypothetical protein
MRSKIYLICFFLSFFGFVESEVVKSCGDRSSGRGNIINKTGVIRGDWPWIAAFAYVLANSFFCAGNLIGASHIISGKFIH